MMEVQYDISLGEITVCHYPCRVGIHVSFCKELDIEIHVG
jgi:hypothetical protein